MQIVPYRFIDNDLNFFQLQGRMVLRMSSISLVGVGGGPGGRVYGRVNANRACLQLSLYKTLSSMKEIIR